MWLKVDSICTTFRDVGQFRAFQYGFNGLGFYNRALSTLIIYMNFANDRITLHIIC